MEKELLQRNSWKVKRIQIVLSYMISMAKTVDVKKNGRQTQNHSGFISRKPTITINETKDMIQYNPFDFFASLIIL